MIPKAFLLSMMLVAALSAHIYMIIAGLPEIFWIVDQQTAYISAAIEIIIVPLLLFIGLKKLLVSLHDRQRPIPEDVFKDENQLW